MAENDPGGMEQLILSQDTFLPKTSNPFPVAPDPMFARTPKKAKAATKQAIHSADPYDTFQHDPALAYPSDQGLYGGQDYRFTAVTDPTGGVEDYTARGKTGDLPDNFDSKAFKQYLGYKNKKGKYVSNDLPGEAQGDVTDPAKLSDKEYDTLTQEASRGNKLAREILVRGHYKAHDFPTLTQDLNKIEDPFVKALSNLPNVANAGEAQVGAVTAPYDFSNAESQVNNILTNQGYAAANPPSAATQAYVGKLDAEAAGNPLTTSTLGLPSIQQALGGLGPAAKVSEKTAPNSALLAALLSHIQYQDVYGTGLSAGSAANNPAWLQELLASVTGTSLTGGLPNPATAAASIGAVPSTSPSAVPNTG